MTTAHTSAPGVPLFPAQGSAPHFRLRKQSISHVDQAILITAAQHRRWSTEAQSQLCTESSQHIHLELLEIRVAISLSRTLSRRHTVETCSRNTHSTLPKTNLSPLRLWNQTSVHTWKNIASTEHHEGNLLRTAPTQNWHNRRHMIKGITITPVSLKVQQVVRTITNYFFLSLMQHKNQGIHTGIWWTISGNKKKI